ncbi:MAG: phage tail sheath family protein [Bacteroidia bacterium]|nr:phage tail sheath family protein [Bacteroidia bacterium]
MANYNTPGVFVEEINTLGSSVASVPTAIPGFVGFTKQAILPDGNPASDKPVRITSLLEYEAIFGGPKNATFALTLGGTVALPTIATFTPTLPAYKLYYYMQLFFANGGGACYVVSVGNDSVSMTSGLLTGGIAKLEQVDEVTLLVAPEATELSSGRLDVNNAMLEQCSRLKDRFAILDALDGAGNVATDATNFRAEVGANDLKYGAAYYPALNTSLNYTYTNAGVTITTDGRSDGAGAYTGKTLDNVLTGSGSTTINKTIANLITSEILKYTLRLYPSSAMAGVYARVDASRGVWKAPANVGINFVIAPSTLVTDSEQAGLNIDAASGKSINVIRQFSGKGTIVWGARTLAGNDNEWRYINVRRLFNFVEESIQKATEFVVFEPNTAGTWQRVKGMCEAFLTNLWRDGALAGATPKDAFFVSVGLGTTMTADDILNGKMIVEIGIAAVRPAEFIVLRFSHKLQES